VQDPVRHSSEHRNPLPVKEAGAINKSLSALTNVIIALQDERKRRRQIAGGPCQRHFVNYRDSKLTLLLRDSLGGLSRIAIVANVSPSAICSMETLSTLRFAARAKRIRCNFLQKEAPLSFNAAAMESRLRELLLLRKRLSDSSFCAQTVASRSIGGDTLSARVFSPSCVTCGMEEAVEHQEDVQVCMGAANRELDEAAEVGARLHVAAQATKDTAIHEAGGATGRARPSSPSLAGSATFCDHFDSSVPQETPIPKPSIHERPRPHAFRPLVALSPDGLRAAGSTQTWAHI